MGAVSRQAAEDHSLEYIRTIGNPTYSLLLPFTILNSVDMATNTETNLMRYNELLEKRINQLEILLKESNATDAPKADDSKESKESATNGTTKEKSTETKPKEKEPNKKEEDSKPITRYRNILRKWDRKAGAHKDEDVSATALKKPESKDIAYTFRRIYDPSTGEKGAYSELDIEGEELIAILKRVIDNKYPGVNFDGELVTMSAPFSPLVMIFMQLRLRPR